MRAPASDPVRWRDKPAGANEWEDRAGQLASAVDDVPLLGPDALSRIRAAALMRGSVRGARTVQHLPVRLRIVLAGGLVVVLVGTAGGASSLWRRYVAESASRTDRTVVAGLPAPPRQRGSRTRTRTLTPAAPSGPVVEPPDATTPARPDPAAPMPADVSAPAPATEPIPARARRWSASRPLQSPPRTVAISEATPAPTEARLADEPRPVEGLVSDAPAPALPGRQPADPPRGVATPTASNRPAPRVSETRMEARVGVQSETEARLLARAISELRRARDPRAALATLDRYVQLFPHGVLASESARTRLEALLQLNDFPTALSLLDDKVAFVGPLDADLLLTRAELRAGAGRCRDAVADFTRGLDDQKRQPADGARERALYGRAVCLGRLGQDDRARADLTNYLGHFPAGRFAFEARRLLEGRNGPGRP